MRWPEYGYSQGQWRPFDEACAPLDDRAFLYGDAVFETLRVDPEPWLAEEHWRRLRGSLRALRLPLSRLVEVREVVRKRPATAGPYTLRVTVSRTAVYATLRPSQLSARPVTLMSVGPRPAGLLPWTAKHANYLPSLYPVLGTQREVLWLDSKKRVLETGTGSVLALFGERLVTPAAEGLLLAGTTVAAFAPQSKALSLHRLLQADAVWVASAINILRPVGRIDGHAMAMSKSLTSRLIGEYRRVACVSPSST